MLGTSFGEAIDGTSTGTFVALSPVSFSIDGRGESESRLRSQYIGLRVSLSNLPINVTAPLPKILRLPTFGGLPGGRL